MNKAEQENDDAKNTKESKAEFEPATRQLLKK